ncbi:MAG TPA: hypothetical protein VJ305_17735 [Streptosporangiaceae bacterium]|nr:hypothetical protein [Streptosporangiaceae bacterium]
MAITERGFLAALDVGCSAPVGALAELTGDARSSRRCASPASSPTGRLFGALGSGDRVRRRRRRGRPPAGPQPASEGQRRAA